MCSLLARTSRDNRLYLSLVVGFAKEVVRSRARSGFADSAVWATLFSHDPALVELVFQAACEFVSLVPIRRLFFVPDQRVWDTIR
jgi:hypothetical protein